MGNQPPAFPEPLSSNQGQEEGREDGEAWPGTLWAGLATWEEEQTVPWQWEGGAAVASCPSPHCCLPTQPQLGLWGSLEHAHLLSSRLC